MSTHRLCLFRTYMYVAFVLISPSSGAGPTAVRFIFRFRCRKWPFRMASATFVIDLNCLDFLFWKSLMAEIASLSSSNRSPCQTSSCTPKRKTQLGIYGRYIEALFQIWWRSIHKWRHKSHSCPQMSDGLTPRTSKWFYILSRQNLFKPQFSHK